MAGYISGYFEVSIGLNISKQLRFLLRSIYEHVQIAVDAAVREKAIHIFGFRAVAASVAFIATSYLAQTFALVPLEEKVQSNFIIAQAEVNYYKYHDTKSLKEVALAQGRLAAAESSKEYIYSAVNLLSLVAETVYLVALTIFVFSVGHWWQYVVVRKKDENAICSSNEND